MKFAEMPYQRVDTDAVVAGLKELTQELKAAKSGEEQFAIHQKFYELRDEYSTMIQIAMIRSDVDTADAFYSEEKDYYNEVLPTISNQETEYRKVLYYSPYKAELEEKIGKVAFKSMELEFKAMDEKLIPLMQEENALTTRYDNLIASAKIDWDGETLNLSLLRPYMTHEDREIRRRAHEKYSAFFQSKAEELDEIYDKLVKNRTAQARLLGYENYVELGYYRMNRNSYGREEVENFRRQIKEYFVPLAEKMHERRRERLGLQKLSYIDENMYFVDGNPKPQGTPEEIMANGQKMYEELSPETKEFTMKPDTYDAILVDEANFLSSEQVEWLAEICDQYDIPVLCYGLKTDFRGVLFEGSKRLMELADAIEELPIICWCGKKAHFNARVIDGKMVRDGAQIALGANDMYVPLCRRHFMSGEIKPYQTVEEK